MATHYYDDEGVADNWENMLDEEEAAPAPGQPSDAKKGGGATEKPGPIVMEKNDDEEDGETRALRTRLAERWSDMQNVTHKNVVLLHERTPQTLAERVDLNKDIASLALKQKDSKHFSAFLDTYVRTVAKQAMEGTTVPGKVATNATIVALKEVLLARAKTIPATAAPPTRSIPAAVVVAPGAAAKAAKAEMAAKYSAPKKAEPVVAPAPATTTTAVAEPTDGYGRKVVQSRDVDDFM